VEDEAAESCTIDGESPVVTNIFSPIDTPLFTSDQKIGTLEEAKVYIGGFKKVLSRVAWDTWNPV
jgi:hypothetical protein